MREHINMSDDDTLLPRLTRHICDLTNYIDRNSQQVEDMKKDIARYEKRTNDAKWLVNHIDVILAAYGFRMNQCVLNTENNTVGKIVDISDPMLSILIISTYCDDVETCSSCRIDHAKALE